MALILIIVGVLMWVPVALAIEVFRLIDKKEGKTK